MSKTTFIATGDLFITRRLPENGYKGFDELSHCIRSHDVAFTNLEMTFHNCEGYPNAVSGGTWAMTSPVMLDDIRRFGFNIYNTANNHSCDYSHGGVLATAKHLKERNMIFSGTGANLSEAGKPCYLETKNARVALISCCHTTVETAAAGAQSADMPGRPGLNLMRSVCTYHLDKEHFAMAKELVAASGVNAARERTIRLGYAPPFPEGKLPFAGVMFVEDERNFVEAKPNPKDMARIENEIREARRQADVVLVSIHSHDCPAGVGNKPTDFLETFSRNCIDAGAHAVLGHGPHELRGIEVYKGGVIFHGLGNFIVETETVEFQPADAYLNRSMPLDTKVGAYMDERSQNGTRGFAVQEWIWKSVMAGFTMEDGRITQVQLYPIDLGQNKPRGQKGKPVMTYDENTLAYLAGLSEPYGTTLRVDNGVGYIDL